MWQSDGGGNGPVPSDVPAEVVSGATKFLVLATTQLGVAACLGSSSAAEGASGSSSITFRGSAHVHGE